MALTYRPIKLETVVVLRGDRVVGTIKRYRAYRRCIVSVPGLLSSATHPGQANFATVGEAKARLNQLEAAG